MNYVPNQQEVEKEVEKQMTRAIEDMADVYTVIQSEAYAAGIKKGATILSEVVQKEAIKQQNFMNNTPK